MSELREEYNEHEVELEDIAHVGEVIRKLRDNRDTRADLAKVGEELRKELIQMLDERGNRVYDEVSGLEAVLKTETRWEWDAQKLRETGELRDEEIAKVMVNSVDKKRMSDLILAGTARARMVESAKVPTKVIEKIEIHERASTRRLV